MSKFVRFLHNRLMLLLLALLLCSMTLVYNKSWLLENVLSNNKGEYVVNTMEIADIFVPIGQSYNAQDGIVYNCITRSPHTIVKSPTERQRFVVSQSKTSQHEDGETRQKTFQTIFEKQVWMEGKLRTPQLSILSPEYRASGEWATLEAGQPSLALLNSLIDRLKIFLKQSVISIVDIPCGDFYWMRQLVGLRSDIYYTGIDIAPGIIERNRMIFKKMKNAQFILQDIVESGLNKSYDIIFNRDMLQTLTYDDIQTVLAHFSDSDSKILVTTNLVGANKYVDLDLNKYPARYRHINLMLPPMNLVPPVCTIKDNIANVIKDLSIWTLPLQQKE